MIEGFGLTLCSAPDFACFLEAIFVALIMEKSCFLGEIVLSPGARALVAQPDLANALRSHICTASGVGHRPIAFHGNNRIWGGGCRLISLHRTQRRNAFLLITESDQ